MVEEGARTTTTIQTTIVGRICQEGDTAEGVERDGCPIKRITQDCQLDATVTKTTSQDTMTPIISVMTTEEVIISSRGDKTSQQ